MCARPVTPGGGQYALSEMTETGTETDVKAGILTDLTRERDAKVLQFKRERLRRIQATESEKLFSSLA